MGAGFRKVNFDLHHVETVGPWVAVACRGVAVSSNDLPIDFSGIDLFRLCDDERIVHQPGYWDPSRLAG